MDRQKAAAGVARDLQNQYAFVAAQASLAQAERLLGRIEALAALGIRDYRQVFSKPYRVICRPTSAKVLIFLVADGGCAAGRVTWRVYGSVPRGV